MYLGEIAALLTALSWVGSSMAFEYAGKKVGSLILNLMRLVVSFVIITIINFFLTNGFTNIQMSIDTFNILLLSGLIGFVFGDIFLFQAFILIGARISLLIKALAPPITAILGYFILNENLGRSEIIGMVVIVLGIAIVITGRNTQGSKNRLVFKHSWKGITYALLGTLGQALGMVFSKMGMVDTNPFLATQVRIIAGIIGFVIIITYMKKWVNFINTFKLMDVMKGITVGSIFGPVIGVSLSMTALKYTSTAIASTMMALSPIFAIPISYFFFKEKIKVNEIVGAFISVIGVGIIFL